MTRKRTPPRTPCATSSDCRSVRQPHRYHPQARNVAEVLRVRREQRESSLDRLRGEPEVVDAEVSIPPRLLQRRGQRPEGLGGVDGDAQLWLPPQSAQGRSRPLFLG